MFVQLCGVFGQICVCGEEFVLKVLMHEYEAHTQFVRSPHKHVHFTQCQITEGSSSIVIVHETANGAQRARARSGGQRGT